MANIEKVIKGLKAHADGCGYRSHHCDAMECPYRYGDESCDIEEMCRDALELLKEQEAVMPISEHHLFLCPVCKNTLFREQKFCHECGKHIEWKWR